MGGSLWLAVSGTEGSLRWFAFLVGCLLVSGIYRVIRGGDLNKVLSERRLLAKATAASLGDLRELVLGCDDAHSVDRIQAGILSIIVDKTAELIGESRDGLLSANIMVANENTRELKLTVFNRNQIGRVKITIPFDTVGAGRAIVDMKPVYIPDIRTDDMHTSFRSDAPYRSILSIPVACEHKRLGVVNLDSTEKEHFPMRWLEDHLSPYVQLLGLTLCYNQTQHKPEEPNV